VWHLSVVGKLDCSDFTNIAPRDLSVKKDDAALQEGKDDQEQCYDLSTTSRVRDGDAIQQVMLHNFCLI